MTKVFAGNCCIGHIRGCVSIDENSENQEEEKKVPKVMRKTLMVLCPQKKGGVANRREWTLAGMGQWNGENWLDSFKETIWTD